MPVLLVALIWMVSAPAVWAGAPLVVPSAAVYTERDAQRINQHAKGALAPAYPCLAEFVVERYRLAATPGIGIDLGGGPQYDLDQTGALFRKLMADLSVREFKIVRPRPEAEVNYGIWVDFAKPSGGMDDE